MSKEQTIYQRQQAVMSYKNYEEIKQDRKAYLKDLSESYDVPFYDVIALAQILGKEEDYEYMTNF